jgi:hypothetical protein
MSHHRCPSNWLRAALLVSTFLVAKNLPAQGSEDELPKMRQGFVLAAMRFQLTGGTSGADAFDLRSQPALNWSNPERRTHAGAMFLWTLDGRPQAAMCMYPNGEKRFDLEFQSLSSLPFSATSDGQSVWEPDEAGIEFHPLERAASPAASLPVRLRQMRKLAREFSAKLVPPNRTVVPLRLLSAPIYRYPPPDRRSEVIDGAVFAFAQATDPEVLLIIEAIGNNPQDERWRYGLARMSMVPTNVMHHDKVVWETDWAAIRQRSGPYYVISQYEAEITSSD